MQGGVWQEVVWDIKCNANCRRIQDTFGLRVNASIVKAPCRGSGCSGDRDKSNDVLLGVNQIQSSSCCEGQPQAGAGKVFQCLNYFSYTCQKKGTASNTWYQGFGTMLSRDFIHYILPRTSPHHRAQRNRGFSFSLCSVAAIPGCLEEL